VKGTSMPTILRAVLPAFCVFALCPLHAQAPFSGAYRDFTVPGGEDELLHADLQDANLLHANLRGLHLADKDLRGASLDNADLTGTHLERAKMEPSAIRKRATSLAGADLTGAFLKGATLTGADLTYAILNRADFSNAKIKDAKFSTTLAINTDLKSRVSFRSVIMPCLFVEQWKYLDLDGADLTACAGTGDLKDKNFEKAQMAGARFSTGDPTKPMNLERTIWRGADLRGATFTSSFLEDARFDGAENDRGARLSNADLSFVVAPRARFDYADLGFDAAAGTPGAKLNFAALGGATFKHANLRRADLSYAMTAPGLADRFAGAELEGAKFRGADLSGADLKGLDAKGVDFANAILADVNFKNTVLSPSNLEACDVGKSTVSLPADLTGAYLCGATIEATNLNCANMTAAFGPRKEVSYDLSGETIKCKINFVSVTTNGVERDAKTGLAGCFTTCPDGSPGPCTGEERWQWGSQPVVAPCCTAGPACRKKAAGGSCKSNCECSSGMCLSAKCAAPQIQ
jgi:uncharacterized protein YjbI with pentapeptide repeats